MSEPPIKVAPWEDIVLRIIAIYKFIKAAVALLLGLTLLKLIHHDLVLFLQTYIIDPFHLDPDPWKNPDSENHFLKWLYEAAANLTPHRLRLLAYLNFFYAAVFATEGTGLYLKKHWAEYFVVIVTGSFLPMEGYWLYYKLAWWKVVLMLGNVLIIVYLLHRILLEARAKAAQATADGASPSGQVPSEVH
ncbi:MAG TPA: DUF2127 domain-containing protein [Candidatus Methylacidiphilales bacterium]|nr:DUF2127 domain-containing protein [Candidatus Methylacidiphilales bacterium]